MLYSHKVLSTQRMRVNVGVLGRRVSSLLLRRGLLMRYVCGSSMIGDSERLQSVLLNNGKRDNNLLRKGVE